MDWPKEMLAAQSRFNHGLPICGQSFAMAPSFRLHKVVAFVIDRGVSREKFRDVL